MVLDRKSTRLNSSHLVISYAVFCLKKKKKKKTHKYQCSHITSGCTHTRVDVCTPRSHHHTWLCSPIYSILIFFLFFFFFFFKRPAPPISPPSPPPPPSPI